MSHSPEADGGDTAAYEAGWTAVNKLLRRGRSWSGHERNVALLNCGEGPFADVSAVTDFHYADDARAAVTIDWDRDGDLDLFTTNRTAPRLRFLENSREGNGRFLDLRLEGRSGNRDAIGARVELTDAAGRRQLATVHAGEGYLAQSSRWVHFGLPPTPEREQAEALQVVVRWPLGEPQVFEGLVPGGRYHLVEGEAARPLERSRSGERLAATELTPPEPTSRARIVLAAPVPLPPLTALGETERGQLSFGEGGAAAPTLLQVWASWCAPCIGELKSWTAAEPEIRASGLRVLALSADEEADRHAARLFLDRLRWPFGRGYATPETLDHLDVLHDILLDREARLPLPTSWLVDAQGRLLVLYLGPVEPAQVLADMALAAASPAELRDAAVPFPGRWHHPAPEPDLFVYESKYRKRGFPEVARHFHLGQVEHRSAPEARLQHEFGLARARQGRLEESLTFFAKSIEIDPYYAPAHGDRGIALHHLGRYAEAVAAFREALRLTPDAMETWYNLGLAFLQLGDRDGALEVAEQLAAGGDERADVMRAFAARLSDD